MGARPLFLTLALAAACGDSPFAPPPADGAPGAGDFDSRAVLLRGPYLQLPTRDSIVVLWSTDLPSSSIVEYGTTTAYGATALGRTYRYEWGLDGDPPSGWLHEVRITGLEPSTTYHYRIGDLAEATFRTAPTDGETFTAAIWGDTRTRAEEHRRIVEAIDRAAPDIGIFTGDLVNSPSKDEQWTEWFAIEAPLIAHVPFYPAFGNHEGQSGGARYDLSFVGPETSPLFDQYGERSARSYSFDYGSLHVLVFDAYMDRAAALAFAEADLASEAAQAAKFRLITLHPPMYTYSYHAPNLDLRATLVPIAREHGVQAIFVGHNHAYERFFLGDLHQVVGGGGGAPSHGIDRREPDSPDLRVAAYVGLSFTLATFAGDTATFRTMDIDGATVDCFVIDLSPPAQMNADCL